MTNAYLDGFLPPGQVLSVPNLPAVVAPLGHDVSAPPSRPRRRRKQPLVDASGVPYEGPDKSQLDASPLVSARAGLAERVAVQSDRAKPASVTPLNNMGVQSSQSLYSPDISNVHVAAGIDKISLFVFGDWAGPDAANEYCPGGAKAMRAELESSRDGNRVRKYSQGVAIYGGTCYGFDGHPIYGKKVRCPIQVHVDGMRIAMGDIDRVHPDFPIAQVIIDSAALSARGHHGCLKQLEVLLRGLGMVVREMTVLRLDVCADLIGVNAAAFLNYMHTGKAVITKFDWAKRSTWGPPESLETVAVGTSDNIRLQCYDKLKRLRDQLDEGKESEVDYLYRSLIERWGCIPEDVLRVEFQLGGKYLRGRFCRPAFDGRKGEPLRCIGEVVDRLDAICEVLFSEQFRVASAPVDVKNKNYSRAVNHQVWQLVLDGVRGTNFAANELSCDCVQRIKREVRAKSVNRAEQDLRSLAVRCAAIALEPEQIAEMRSVEQWAEFMTRVAVSAASGKSSDMIDAALAKRNEWGAKNLLPDISRGDVEPIWTEENILGFNVAVDRVWTEDVGESMWPLVGPPSKSQVPF